MRKMTGAAYHTQTLHRRCRVVHLSPPLRVSLRERAVWDFSAGGASRIRGCGMPDIGSRDLCRGLEVPTSGGLWGSASRSISESNVGKMHSLEDVGCGFRGERLRIEELEVVPGYLRFRTRPFSPTFASQHSVMHSGSETVCEHSQERLRWRGTRTVLPSTRAFKVVSEPGVRWRLKISEA